MYMWYMCVYIYIYVCFLYVYVSITYLYVFLEGMYIFFKNLTLIHSSDNKLKTELKYGGICTTKASSRPRKRCAAFVGQGKRYEPQAVSPSSGNGKRCTTMEMKSRSHRSRILSALYTDLPSADRHPEDWNCKNLGLHRKGIRSLDVHAQL